MTVSCPDCKSVFRVDPSKVPATGVRARCSVCGGVIVIAGGTLLVSVTPVAGAQPPRPTPEGRMMTPPVPSVAAVPAQKPPLEGLKSVRGDLARGGSATPAEGKRPINPFLRADPAQRARRLARALVSDLVAYHPQKRDEGLRDGTLRQLFREEIKKSYEEYVEQVGREVAEHSPHFQDALNELLAGGQRLF